MTHRIRTAGPSDRDTLVELMREFYAESKTPFETGQTIRAFEKILRDDTLGRIWILERNGSAAGYAVLTFGFSMEYGGRDAFVDDLFVRVEHRCRGLGRAAMEAMMGECGKRGVRALHLEVARDNLAAKQLYRRFGFKDNDRQLMTVRLKSDDAAI